MKEQMKQIMTKLDNSPHGFEHSNHKGPGDSVFGQDSM